MTNLDLRAYADVETTGISRGAGAVIVEVGLVVVDSNWEEVATYQSVVAPGEKAMAVEGVDNALKVNGLSRELISKAPDTGMVADTLNSILDMGEIKSIHAFNNNFDSKFLEVSPFDIAKDFWGDCVMLTARRIMKGGKFPKLIAACEYFGIPVDASKMHRALEDARCAMLVHKAIIQDRPRVPQERG